jgi:ribose-phosphate pyrophosphokinase
VSLLLGFPDYAPQGRRLADALGWPYAEVQLHRFPDGESRVVVPTGLPPHVVVCRSLDRPNDKLVELLLTAQTARAEGARRLTLAAPYLCYMRQDIAFTPGEAVSQRIVGGFLAGLFDAVLTVDPHLHRIERLEEAVPTHAAVALSAAPALSAFLAEVDQAAVVVAPDGEARQWAAAIAEPAGLDCLVAEKVRRGDREVEVRLPDYPLQGRTVVIVDDMISTGRTLITVAETLKARGAAAVHCLVTHPLFADDAAGALRAAGVERVWSSDSISHESNAIGLADLLADAVRALENDRPAPIR